MGDVFRVEYERTERRTAYVIANSVGDAREKFMDWENVTEDLMEYGIDENIELIEKEDY